MRGRLVTAAVSFVLGLSSALALPVASAPVSAAAYVGHTGYTQGNAIAQYDTISGWTGTLAKYNGPLYARYNATEDTGVSSTFGEEYQCVELVQRYFYLKHWTTVKNWQEDAPNLASGIPNGSKGPEAIYERQAGTVAPKPGDILVFTATPKGTTWSGGHVALITGVASTQVTFIQQNIAYNVPGGRLAVALDELTLTKTVSGSTATYSIGSNSTINSEVTYSPVAGWIHAVDNTEKAPAPAVVVPPVPDAPANLKAVGAGPGKIKLMWVPGAVPGSSNQIVIVSSPGVHTSSDPRVSVPGGATETYTWSGLTVGRRYCFDIRAVDGNGTSVWAAPGDAGCAVAKLGPPAAPTNAHLTSTYTFADNGPTTQWTVTWREASPAGVSIRLYGLTTCLQQATPTTPQVSCVTKGMAIPSADLQVIRTVPASAGSYSWSGPGGEGDYAASVWPGTLYYGLFLVAVNGSGRSSPVLVASAGACYECTL
jgi:hypothetical protein